MPSQESSPTRARSIWQWALGRANTKQFRYLAVGGWNTAFGFALFVGLQLTVGGLIGYMAVLAISQVVGILNAYLTYRLIVFRVKGQWIRDFFRFSAVYWAVFALNVIVLPLLVSGLGWNVILAQTVFFVVTVIYSYIAHNRFSFRRPHPDGN